MSLENLEEWKHDSYRKIQEVIDRRSFLKGGISAMSGAALFAVLGRILAPHPAGAASSRSTVRTGTFFFPRLRFDVVSGRQEWNVYPHADGVVRRALSDLTNVNVSQEPVVVSLDDFDHMQRYPFVFATEQKAFSFPENEENNLRRFLLRGGFLFGDDCVLGGRGDIFFQTFRTMMNRIYADNPMRRVPDDHEIFHCFFSFPNGLPHLQGVPHGLWATFDKGTDRLLTVLSPSDLHCGWVSNPGWFPMALNQQAVRMGINIIIYYLTH